MNCNSQVLNFSNLSYTNQERQFGGRGANHISILPLPRAVSTTTTSEDDDGGGVGQGFRFQVRKVAHQIIEGEGLNQHFWCMILKKVVCSLYVVYYQGLKKTNPLHRSPQAAARFSRRRPRSDGRVLCRHRGGRGGLLLPSTVPRRNIRQAATDNFRQEVQSDLLSCVGGCEYFV